MKLVTAHSFASFLSIHSAPMPYFVGVHLSLLEVRYTLQMCIIILNELNFIR